MMSLVILAFVFIAFSVRAQIHSAAFDPNCYQPQIGIDIDTIMGAKNGQELGNGLINIGPSPENPEAPGRLMMYGLPGTLTDSMVGSVIVPSGMAVLNVGPAFNAQKPNITKQPGFKIFHPIPGHFRSQKYIDLLTVESVPKIFWQKDDGTYDSSLYTILQSAPKIVSWAFGDMTPYHTYLSSDTAEDILLSYENDTSAFVFPDSQYFCIYRGGMHLFKPGASIFADGKVGDTMSGSSLIQRLGYIGDFRGTGRQDFITLDSKGNLFYYQNEPPFNLSNFVHSLKNDTLFAAWTEPWLNKNYFALSTAVIRMREGEAQSLALSLDSAVGSPSVVSEIRIVPGGSDFGKERLKLENTIILHSPSFFDQGYFGESGWPNSIVDCGTMAGTPDHVLAVSGDIIFGGSFYTFYVMGDSFDEKADMFLYNNYSEAGQIDTATLDADGLQDVVIGEPLLPDQIINGADHRYKGTVLFVHGSKKIPVKNRSVKHAASSNEDIWAWQSSDGKWLSLHLPDDEVGPCHIVLRDILGRPVCELTQEVTTAPKMLLPPHPAGTYILQVTIGEKSYQRKLAIM